MSPDGSAPRLCRFSSRRKSFTGASGAAATWCATGMGVGGFSSPFRGQERWLRLKTNARGVPVSARCCRYQRANNCDRRRSGTLRLSRSPPCFGGQQMRPIAAFVGRGRAATPNVQGLGNQGEARVAMNRRAVKWAGYKNSNAGGTGVTPPIMPTVGPRVRGKGSCPTKRPLNSHPSILAPSRWPCSVSAMNGSSCALGLVLET